MQGEGGRGPLPLRTSGHCRASRRRGQPREPPTGGRCEAQRSTRKGGPFLPGKLGPRQIKQDGASALRHEPPCPVSAARGPASTGGAAPPQGQCGEPGRGGPGA